MMCLQTHLIIMLKATAFQIKWESKQFWGNLETSLRYYGFQNSTAALHWKMSIRLLGGEGVPTKTH